jgi:hypothetical protein
MSFLCVDVVADVDDALLLENKEETNVFPVCLAEEETFNAFAVALICICLRVRVENVTSITKRLNFHLWEKKYTCVITVDPERYTHTYK